MSLHWHLVVHSGTLDKQKHHPWSLNGFSAKEVEVQQMKSWKVRLCYVLVFSLLEMAVIFNAVDFEHMFYSY